MKLRNLGIYALPDGREFVADVLYSEGRYCLYPRWSWENAARAEYRVGADGRLLRGGQPTTLSVEQLKDTGRRAQYPSSRGLL